MKAELPFIKVCHRNGHVFLRIVRMGRFGRESVVARLDPDTASKLGLELTALAASASRKPKIKEGT